MIGQEPKQHGFMLKGKRSLPRRLSRTKARWIPMITRSTGEFVELITGPSVPTSLLDELPNRGTRQRTAVSYHHNSLLPKNVRSMSTGSLERSDVTPTQQSVEQTAALTTDHATSNHSTSDDSPAHMDHFNAKSARQQIDAFRETVLRAK